MAVAVQSTHEFASKPVISGFGSGSRREVLRLGMWSAWGCLVLYAAYAIAVVFSGVAVGPPKDPAWAVAEALTIVGVPLQIVLFAAIYESASARAKIFGLLAFGLVLIWGGLTAGVHFSELIVARKLDFTADPALARVFDFTQPSLLLEVEILAWQFFLGLAMLCAALAFEGQGNVRRIRVGLLAGGALCLIGLIGPITGVSWLRSIGALGYGVVFPIVLVVMGLVYRAASRRAQPAG